MAPRAPYLALMLAAPLCVSGLDASAQQLRDPTLPYTRAVDDVPGEPTPAEWRLDMVRIGAGERRAVLNGMPVREGQKVGAVTVTRIEAGAVVLNDGAAEFVVGLGLRDIKKALEEPGDG